MGFEIENSALSLFTSEGLRQGSINRREERYRAMAEAYPDKPPETIAAAVDLGSLATPDKETPKSYSFEVEIIS